MPAVLTNTFFICWEKEIQYNMSINNDFINSSIKTLDSYRSEYEKIKNSVVNCITTQLDKEKDFKYVGVFGRAKDSKGLREKIYRKNYAQKYSDAQSFIEDLQDGIGIRIVCFLNNDETRIIDILKSFLNEITDVDGRIFNHSKENNIYICFENQPEKQKNGLDIFRMDAFYQEPGKKLVKMEIQIKSLTNYFWGELEHKLFYKNYNYTISNGFFEGLMMNIHKELLNIDSELTMLQSHLAKDVNAECLEFHQIAALMISKNYEPEIQKILDCKIDLREVYSIIVDLYFGLSTNEKINRERLYTLMGALKKPSKIQERIEEVSTETYQPSEITDKNKEFASVIDEAIHSGDIFWVFFYVIYEDLCHIQADTYSIVLNRLVDQIRSLYSDVSLTVDSLLGYEKIDINAMIDKVMCKIMKATKKISFLSMEYQLPCIKKALCNELAVIEKCVNHANKEYEDIDEEMFNANTTVMTDILYVVAMSSVCEKVKDEIWDFLLNNETENEYDLFFPREIISYIEQSRQLSEERLEILLERFTEEQ